MLADAIPDILACTVFPVSHWQRLWSNNPLELPNKEIRQGTGVVDIFPNRAAINQLVGAVLAEQHDEWVKGRRYLTFCNHPKTQALPTAHVLEAEACATSTRMTFILPADGTQPYPEVG